jgi:hypothetical protein
MVLVLGMARPGFPWGKPGHVIVASTAVQAFPDPAAQTLGLWVQSHRARIVGRSAEPDQEEYGRPYHFVNLEKFLLPNGHFRVPVSLPENDPRGGLPGHVVGLVEQLAQAMKAESTGVPTAAEIDELERLLAWTCHYAADSTCPVHTTIRHHAAIPVIKAGKTNTPGLGQWPVHSVYETDFLQHVENRYGISGIILAQLDSYSPKPLRSVAEASIESVKGTYPYLQPILDTAEVSRVTVVVKGVDTKGKEWGSATQFPQQWDDDLLSGVQTNLLRAGRLTQRLWVTAWTMAEKPKLQ